MTNHEESREEWEQELIDVQRGVTFDAGLRRAQIITKKFSATPAPIPDFAHLVMLILSGAFLVVAFELFSSSVHHKTLFSILALTASCCLGIAAFQRFRKRA